MAKYVDSKLYMEKKILLSIAKIQINTWEFKFINRFLYGGCWDNLDSSIR